MRIQLEELAKFIFVENTENKLVGIQIVEGIQNTFDMFSFCVDLLYKGLHLLYGTEKVFENGTKRMTVRIEDITMDQFMKIKEKLRLAAIEVNLSITEGVTKPNCIYTEIEMSQSETPPVLEQHHMIVSTEKRTYDISFKLIHNVKDI